MSTREEVAARVAEWHASGLCVGMASGAFDLLHVGHVAYLVGLQRHVDKLVVAVMSDERCRSKGENRPIVPEWHRLTMVMQLACVDDAFVFTEYGDDKNLEVIRPDVFGRGSGHTTEMHERVTLERLGIATVIIDTSRLESTTDIINRISSAHR